MDTTQLRTLLNQIQQQDEGHPERQKALNRLLILIPRLPGLAHSPHRDYPVAFNQTLEWVFKNIQSFEERPPSLEKSLVVWINGYLKWRIRDLYEGDQTIRKRQVSLDQPVVNSSGDAIAPLERLADPHPALSTLDGYIAALQADTRQRHGQSVQAHIQQDPDGTLRNCHPRKYPNCHCQHLALRLLVKDPPDRIADIAREFQISNQTLYSHWKQKCLPLLRDIGRRYTQAP
ncbi:MAG: hypothetical protein VKK04_16185 [Synechococcales bacterium]|nr:hypothetical protein [Synechococcales bacterium]